MAWARKDEGDDAQVGAFVLAETILQIRSALTKR
jgi:hypothetical protein